MDMSELRDDFLKREQERARKRKAEKRLLANKTTKKEQAVIEKKAKQIEKYYVYDLWKELFGQASFENEMYGQGLFHVLLGQLLARKKILQSGNNFIDWRVHLLFIQGSGSGKGQGIDFFRKIGERCQKTIDEERKPLRLHKVGRTTSAALINSWEIDPKTKAFTNVIKPGLLANNDVVYWEEAGKLIKGDAHNEDTNDIILTITEPFGSSKNVYEKNLAGYPEPATTKSDCSIVATTRPIENIKSYLLYSGLMQRFMVIIRKLTNKERRTMLEKVSLSSFRKKNDNFGDRMQELSEKIQKVVNFVEDNDINLEEGNEDVLGKYICEKLMWFDEDIAETVQSDEHREVLYSFVLRFRDNLIKLAHHAAAMRMSKHIQEQDIEYAFKFVQKCFNMIKVWLELEMEEDIKIRKDKMKRINTIKRIIQKHHGRVKRSDLVDELSEVFGISVQSVYNLLNGLCESKFKSISFEDGYYSVGI